LATCVSNELFTSQLRRRSDLPQRLLAFANRDWARWAALLLWMALIFAFSAQSQLPSLPQQDTLFKKAAHFCVYAALALLAQRALYRRSWALAGALLLAVLYAASDEWHQSFVPGRHPAATDVLIDTAGAASALLLRAWWRRRN
jgi:VanZ family protein